MLLWNNGGFTLLEMLFAFSIFLVIVAFLPITYRQILDRSPVEIRIQKLEWEVFMSQIKKEVRMSDKIAVRNDRIILERDGSSILYEKYGTSIRRRVDFSGHEIVLQNIAEVRFSEIGNGAMILVRDSRGNEYTGSARSYMVMDPL